MAVLRRVVAPDVRFPDDFGLGISVVVLLASLVVVVSTAVIAVPNPGPRGEARRPEGTVYVDVQPGSVPTLLPSQR